MKDHSEFPTKPNYQAIAESLEAENTILQRQVELQTKRLETLQQGVKDALIILDNFQITGEYEERRAIMECFEIVSNKTGVKIPNQQL